MFGIIVEIRKEKNKPDASFMMTSGNPLID